MCLYSSRSDEAADPSYRHAVNEANLNFPSQGRPGDRVTVRNLRNSSETFARPNWAEKTKSGHRSQEATMKRNPSPAQCTSRDSVQPRKCVFSSSKFVVRFLL